LIVNVDIGLKHAANNKGLYSRLVQKFIDREHNVLDRLLTSIDEVDREATIRTVHTLKSSALTLGANPLGAIAARLEAYWKGGGELTDTLEDIRLMKEALVPVLSFFTDFLDVKPAQVVTKTANLVNLGRDIERLEHMIADNDADAKSVAQVLVDTLNGMPASIEAHKMLARLLDYDFDSAQAILETIKATMLKETVGAL
jgi:HPt (histidine-containing phosphotransfer) domain-containing protein